MSADLVPVTVELPVSQMKWLCAAVLPAASADDVTPLLCGATFTASDGLLTAVATDRYRVHRASVPCNETVRPFHVPRRMLSWIVANAGFFGRANSIIEPVVRLEFVPDELPANHEKSSAVPVPGGTVIATVFEKSGSTTHLSLTSEMSKGNFPPVHRLIDEAISSEALPDLDGTMNLGFLSGTKALASDRYEAAKLTFVRPNANRVGQVLVQYRNGAALVQGTKVFA